MTCLGYRFRTDIEYNQNIHQLIEELKIIKEELNAVKDEYCKDMFYKDEIITNQNNIIEALMLQIKMYQTRLTGVTTI